jgi:DNA mismatch repair protein MutS
MSVVYDYENECLVYDRIMKDGPGNRMYGLEVCKSLFLPADFLETAYQIRNQYCSEIKGDLDSVVSKYNTRKIRGICELCGERMGEEIHHLQWQKDADEGGFIGHFHKNHVANLASVCEECHDKVHHDVGDGADSDQEKTSDITSSPVCIKTDPKKRLVRKKTTKGYKIDSVERVG